MQPLQWAGRASSTSPGHFSSLSISFISSVEREYVIDPQALPMDSMPEPFLLTLGRLFLDFLNCFYGLKQETTRTDCG